MSSDERIPRQREEKSRSEENEYHYCVSCGRRKRTVTRLELCGHILRDGQRVPVYVGDWLCTSCARTLNRPLKARVAKAVQP